MRIGVVGCGYVFDHYMSTWDRHPRLELAGVADIDRSRAEAVSSAYDLHIYESNEALISDPTVDIVANFTSIESHYDVSKAALLAGKQVYSEKPLCPRFDQAKELVELAAGAAGRPVLRAVERAQRFDADDVEGHPRRGSRRCAHRLRRVRRGCTYEHVGYPPHAALLDVRTGRVCDRVLQANPPRQDR